MLFQKKSEIYLAKGNKAEWKAFQNCLRQNGIHPYPFTYEDEVPVGGCCGAKLDVRNFGPNGKIDRRIYGIRVRAEDSTLAQDLLHKALPDYKAYTRK